MNKKNIILLALTCGVMCQNAGANEEHSEAHKHHHHLFDGHIIHKVGDGIKKGIHDVGHEVGNVAKSVGKVAESTATAVATKALTP